MPAVRKLQVIQGSAVQLHQQLEKMANDGWKAISMSSAFNSNAGQVQIAILLELPGLSAEKGEVETSKTAAKDEPNAA